MRFSLYQKKPFIICVLASFLSCEVFCGPLFNSYVDRDLFRIKLEQVGLPTSIAELEKVRQELHDFYPDVPWLSAPLLENSQDGDANVHNFQENIQKTIVEKIQRFNPADRSYDLVNLMDWASCEEVDRLKAKHARQQREWLFATRFMILNFLDSVSADASLSHTDKIEAFLKAGPDLLWVEARLTEQGEELLARIKQMREKTRIIELTKLFNEDLDEFCEIALMFGGACTQMLCDLISFGLPLHLCSRLEDAMLQNPALAEYMSKAIESITPKKIPKKKKKSGGASAKNRTPWQKLFSAVKAGDIKQIEQLLNAGVDITAGSENSNLNFLHALMDDIINIAQAENLSEARNQLLENFIRGVSFLLKKLPLDIKDSLLNNCDVSETHSLIWVVHSESLLREPRFSNELFRLYVFHGAALFVKGAKTTFLHEMLGWKISREFSDFVFDWLEKNRLKRVREIAQALEFFDSTHLTPLHYAAVYLDHASIVRLIDLGAKPRLHEKGYKGPAQIFVEAMGQKSIERRQLDPEELKAIKESEIRAAMAAAKKLGIDCERQDGKLVLSLII